MRYSIADISQKIRKRELTPTVLTEALLRRIDRFDRSIKSYTSLNENALADAERITREIANGKYIGPLHGIPVSVKDLIDTHGIKTTYGSPIFKNNVPKRDAVIIKRLKERGAIILGKTNTHEFGLGIESPPTKNPWNNDRSPGGSSGGSGASLSADLAIFALGTDTGGSIRIPASMCGITGLKPTIGKLPMKGIFPCSWNLDHVGPMCRFAKDIPFLLSEMGYVPPEFPKRKKKLKAGLIGYFLPGTEKRVLHIVEKALDVMSSECSTEIQEIALDGIYEIFEAAETIAMADGATIHKGYFRKYRKTYGKSSAIALKLGMKLSAVEYILAKNFRKKILRVFPNQFKNVDLLILPTLPKVAPRRSEMANFGYKDFIPLFINVEIFDLLGMPAISIPCGFVEELPVGMQIVARREEDSVVIELAKRFQGVSDFHTACPVFDLSFPVQ